MEQTHIMKEFLLNDSAIPKAARADFQIGQRALTLPHVTFPRRLRKRSPW